MSVRCAAKRQSSHHKKAEDKPSEKRKKRISQRRKPTFEKCDDITANLNRVLVERMLLKNAGFNQGSRSVGGTPICLRRKKHHDVNENISPFRHSQNGATDPRTFVSPSHLPTENNKQIVKRRSNSVSYVNRNMMRNRQQSTGSTCISTFASEIALIEADKEADKKYRELILEAENILVNMKNTSSPMIPSPSRRIHNGLANKRVELIKNTELNIELALSKSRNSQPEMQTGNIKDLEHTSPKRQFSNQPCSPIHRFMERNSCLPNENSHYRQEAPVKCPESPAMSRRTPQGSPSRSVLVQSRMREKLRSNGGSIGMNGSSMVGHDGRTPEISPFNGKDQILLAAQKASGIVNRKEIRASSNGKSNNEEALTPSSSDSDERCESRRRAPLMTFR